MKQELLLDYELATAQSGFVVHALLRLVGQAPADAARPPLNFALVLDRSGSMGGEKLTAARDAAAFLLRRVAPADAVALVTYDDTVDTLAQSGNGVAPADLARIVMGVESGGSTNLSGGWLRGREHVAEARREHRMNRVVLLTDGLANVGITQPAALVDLAATARMRDAITTSTIGFGADYDEALLRAMADAGGGNTWYIERPDQAPGVFEEEIEGLLSLAAQNVRVHVRPAPGARFVAVLHDYPVRATPEGTRIEVGDIYGREPKSLLFEFHVPAGAADGDTDIGEITVDAHVLTADGGVARQEVTIPIRSPLSPNGRREPEVRQEMLLVRAARAREDALRRREVGDYAGASRMLHAAVAELGRSEIAGSPLVMEQMADLTAVAQKLADATFDALDAKYTAQRAYNTHRAKGIYEEKLRRRPQP
ncbi:MAG TPA: VWA domain-containing protein [Gemmatimonadaceae bacterium]|nr:VWA domain-containing protein [Gemmatimonadaceae bacterium]